MSTELQEVWLSIERIQIALNRLADKVAQIECAILPMRPLEPSEHKRPSQEMVSQFLKEVEKLGIEYGDKS